MPTRRSRTLTIAPTVLAVLLAACIGASTRAPGDRPDPSAPASAPTKLERARERIEHLVFIVQENRSFDHYFGTFPGAEGIPMRDGRPTVCVPDPILGRCVPPYRTTAQLQEGGSHAHPDSV